MAAKAVRIKAIVGRQQVRAGTSVIDAAYGRSIQKSMAQIRENLYRVIKHIENVTPEALVYGLQPIFDESQMLVPVDTGALHDSGFLRAEQTGHGATVAIGYAEGRNPPYAALVHENLDKHHDAPTQAKFLEEAVNRYISEVQPRVAAFLQSATGIS